MNKKLECLQEGISDCAPACLSSIIKYYGGYIPLEDLRKLLKTDKMGTNAYEIVMASKDIGLEVIGKRLSIEDMKKEKDIYPLIAHTKKENFYHFVVVYGFKKDKVIVMDPAIGFIKIKEEEFSKSYLGVSLLFSKNKSLPKINKENFLLKKIIKMLISDKKYLIILSFLSLIVFIFNLLELTIYKYLLNSLSASSKILILFISFIITKNIVDYIRNILVIKTKIKLDIKVNDETLKNILSLSPEYFKNKSTGEIMSRINDLDLLKDIIIDISSSIFVNILLIMFCLIIMLNINTYLFIISIIFSLCYLIITLLFKDMYLKKVRMLQESKGIYNNNVIESVEAIESISNLNIKDSRLKGLRSNYIALSTLTKQYSKLNIVEHFIKNNLNDICLLFIIVISIYASNKNIISSNSIIVIYMLYNYLINVLKDILNKVPSISYALSNVEKINNLFIKNEEKKEGTIKGNIDVKNLSYTNHYVDILKDINITINEKDKVFIEGESGSGKSTLLKIIMKYKSLYEGEVFIGKENLKNINSNVINSSITYISQQEKLFTDTLINNLILGRDIKKEEIDKVKRICKIDEIINKRKLKEDFLIEESGFNLSGGEKQRIILARALLKNSNYLFIDEALSEVDINMEKQIVKDILKEYKDKTIIYVSHKNEIKELFKIKISIERRNND